MCSAISREGSRTSDYESISLKDSNVSDDLDRALRELLVSCFPQTAHIFRQHRFYQEPPQYRWCVYDNNKLIAHTALHLKKLKTGVEAFDMGGVAEVCVHPDYRRQGIVKLLMKKCDEFLRENSIPFAMLFGEAKIYSSSGYRQVLNKIRHYNPETSQWIIEHHPHAHYKELGAVNWPEGIIDICGPIF